jgi:hypothetical protein
MEHFCLLFRFGSNKITRFRYRIDGKKKNREKEAKFLVLEEGCNRRTSAVLLHIDNVQSVPREHPRSSLLPAAGCPCRSMQPQGQS